MKKFFLFCISVLGVFISIEWDNISLVAANISTNIAWYLGQNPEAKIYNQSLWLSHQSKYSEALSILSPLLDAQDLSHGADVFELSGDLLYRTGGSTGNILTFYHRSRDIHSTERIEQKIMFFSSGATAHDGSDMTNVSSSFNIPEDHTGATLRATRRQELIDANLDRKDSINLDTTLPQDAITRTLELLQTGATIKDW